MNLYQLYSQKIFPRLNEVLTHSFKRHRAKLLSPARGRVLEIGFGSGLSLPHYPKTVKNLVGLEPSKGMRARVRVPNKFMNFKLVAGKAEKIPFEDETFDFVVSHFTLCSVRDLPKSLSEIHRVLKPRGRFLFLEHALNDKSALTRKLQKTLAPVFKKCAEGCNLDRDILAALKKAGFEIDELKTIGYNGFPNFVSPIYRGSASRG